MMTIKMNHEKDTKPTVNKYPYIGYNCEDGKEEFVQFIGPDKGFQLNSTSENTIWAECYFTPVKSITFESQI